MRVASILPSSDTDHTAARRRALALLLTVIAHLLLLMLLIELAPPQFGSRRAGGKLVTFSVAPAAQEEAARASTARKKQASRTNLRPPALPPPPKIKLPPTAAAPWVLTPGLERFDVRHVPPTHDDAEQADASPTEGSSGSSNSARPVAYGPAGQPLYDAAWYREPTDAELAYYLKGTRPGSGFGMIACQTIARYHVDNCEELGETPGSGLARAVREAAWQFLVLPPRVGGRMLVGTWVRIRIDYSERQAK